MSCWSQLAPQDEELHCLVWPGNLQILGALIFTRPIPQNLEVFENPKIFRAVCGSLFFRNPETLKFPEKPSKISWELVDDGYFSLVTLPRKNNAIDETITSSIRESVTLYHFSLWPPVCFRAGVSLGLRCFWPQHDLVVFYTGLTTTHASKTDWKPNRDRNNRSDNSIEVIKSMYQNTTGIGPLTVLRWLWTMSKE